MVRLRRQPAELNDANLRLKSTTPPLRLWQILCETRYGTHHPTTSPISKTHSPHNFVLFSILFSLISRSVACSCFVCVAVVESIIASTHTHGCSDAYNIQTIERANARRSAAAERRIITYGVCVCGCLVSVSCDCVNCSTRLSVGGGHLCHARNQSTQTHVQKRMSTPADSTDNYC